jgi:hypothetical protein
MRSSLKRAPFADSLKAMGLFEVLLTLLLVGVIGTIVVWKCFSTSEKPSASLVADDPKNPNIQQELNNVYNNWVSLGGKVNGKPSAADILRVLCSQETKPVSIKSSDEKSLVEDSAQSLQARLPSAILSNMMPGSSPEENPIINYKGFLTEIAFSPDHGFSVITSQPYKDVETAQTVIASILPPSTRESDPFTPLGKATAFQSSPDSTSASSIKSSSSDDNAVAPDRRNSRNSQSRKDGPYTNPSAESTSEYSSSSGSGNTSTSFANRSSPSSSNAFTPPTVTVPPTTSSPVQNASTATNTDNSGNSGDKNLGQTPAPYLRLSADLRFGAVQVGTGATILLTLENTGNATLLVSSISVPAGFSVDWSSGSIAAGSSRGVNVTFAPANAKDYSGILTVLCNASNRDNVLNISGIGVAASVPQLSVSGDLRFGGVKVGTSAAALLTLQNTGNATLLVSSISVPSGFSVDWASGSIDAGSSRNVTVSFLPLAEQDYFGDVEVISNAASTTNTIRISGTGAPNAIPQLNISGDLNFGTILVGTSTTAVLTLENTGDAPLEISSIILPSGFSVDWASGSIAAASSRSITFTFSPQFAGNFQGLVEIRLNSDSEIKNVSVTAFAENLPKAASALLADASALNQISISWTNADDFTIIGQYLQRKLLESSSNWTTIIELESNKRQYVDTNIEQGKTYSYRLLTYNHVGTSSISSSPSLVVTASRPSVISLQDYLDFGRVAVGGSSSIDLVISNTGGIPLTVDNIVMPTGFVSDWSSGIILAGGSQTAHIVFRPVKGGSYSGVITVNSDAALGNNTVNINAEGVVPPSAPSSLTVNATSPNSVQLSWTSPLGTNTLLQRQDPVTGDWNTIATIPAGTNTYIDNSVLYRGVYTYRVIASNIAGNSASSGRISAVADNSPSITFNAQSGLSGILYNGIQYYSGNYDSMNIFSTDNSGASPTENWLSLRSKTFDALNNRQVNTYYLNNLPAVVVTSVYTLVPNGVKVNFTLQNLTSDRIITGYNFLPFTVGLPADNPAVTSPEQQYWTNGADGSLCGRYDYNGNSLYMVNNTPGPQHVVEMISTGGGPHFNVMRIGTANIWGTGLGYDVSFPPAPIPPGGSDNFSYSLLFWPSSTSTSVALADVIDARRSASPFSLDWPDRRPIAMLFPFSGGQQFPTRPKDPAQFAAYQQRVLAFAQSNSAQLASIGVQGMIVWDVEGPDQFDPVVGGYAYAGDPRILPQTNPAFDQIADQFFQYYRDAGLKTGVCLRFNTIVPNSRGGYDQIELANDTEMVDKAAYARSRWGCTIFYVDSVSNSRTRPLKLIHDQYPDTLLSPETVFGAGISYSAFSAPYRDGSLGYTATPASVQTVYPNAFSIIRPTDTMLNNQDPRLIDSVRAGNILIGYGAGALNKAVSIINAAGHFNPTVSQSP